MFTIGWLVVAHLPGIPLLPGSWPLLATGGAVAALNGAGLLLVARGRPVLARHTLVGGGPRSNTWVGTPSCA